MPLQEQREKRPVAAVGLPTRPSRGAKDLTLVGGALVVKKFWMHLTRIGFVLFVSLLVIYMEVNAQRTGREMHMELSYDGRMVY